MYMKILISMCIFSLAKIQNICHDDIVVKHYVLFHIVNFFQSVKHPDIVKNQIETLLFL